jgi:quercetin dioxygenase-like cupin family protein
MNALRQNWIILTALVTFGATMSATAQEKSAATPAAKQGSAVFNWAKLEAKPTGSGARREVTDLPTTTLDRFECHITTLNPGLMSHPPHKHPQEEFIILKEGTLDVSINGQVTRVGPGSLFFFASNDMHNVHNVGETPATYLVFNVATAATKTAPAEGAAAAARPNMLPSRVFDWEKLEAKPTETGARRDIVLSSTLTCTSLEAHVTTLNGGASAHAPHRHPDEEIVVVKEGLVEATIDGKAEIAGPGSIFFYTSNAEHGMKNAGNSSASYYVFRITTEATPSAHPDAPQG